MAVKDFIDFMFVPVCIFLMLGVVVYTVSLGFVMQHENVHKAINKNYGLESEIYIDYFTMSGMTVSYDNEGKCNENCEILHSLNEIVTYNMDSLMNGIYGVSFILLIVILFIYLEIRYYTRTKLKILKEKYG